MALAHSPKVITDSLVFAYDMNNKKSYQGAPTTNYVTNASLMSGWNNYSNTANGTPAQFITDFGTTGYYMAYVGSWNGIYRGISLPSTGTYTFSAWFRYMGGSANQIGGSVYVSGWGGGDSATYVDKSKIGVWQRVSLTLNCTTTSMTFYLISYGGTNNADNASWQVTMPQIEAGSVATPFVNGTRASTSAVVDLMGNYTLTPTGMSYNSDGTLGFTGSSYLDFNSTSVVSGTNPFTFDAFYTTTGATADEIFGNYGSGYTSGNLWISGRYGAFISGSVYFPGAPIGAGTYHMAVTRDGVGNVVLYKNGVQVNSGSLTSSIPSNINFRIGADVNGAGEPFTGKIHTMKVYNRTLTASEVSQNFNALRGRFGL